MQSCLRAPVCFFLFVLTLALRTQTAQAARLALVIGNDTYTEVRKLKNARNDAQAMARELTAAGFKVTLQPDADRDTLFKAVDRFTLGVRKEDEVVFYFSGHGVQLGAAAYLLPTDIRSESERQVARDGLALDQIAADLGKARYALLVIDACRDNPFPRTATKSIGLDRGLQPIDAEGVDILMAAGPGQKALDRLSEQDPDPNGLFTREFIRLMKTPGLPVRDLLSRVREEVAAKAATVSHRQRPSLREDSNGAFTFYASRAPEPPRVQSQETPAPVAVQQRPRVAVDASPSTRPSSAPPSVFKDCPECPEMVVIPAGSFDMGSPDGEAGRNFDEGPVHRVQIGRAFGLGKTEVTQGQWQAVMGSNPSSNYQCGDTCPVERVSWVDAQKFIRRLNAKTGQEYRLPSEAEWEYACRAGGQDRYCGGDDLDRVAWYGGNNGDKTYRVGPKPVKELERLASIRSYIHPVGRKAANAWGLHDMNGNVNELVEDCYHGSYAGAPSDGRAWVEGTCVDRISRGGSWLSAPQDARAAHRVRHFSPTYRSNNGGFRLARTLP
jgi:formylglycine-generating enzyme required for sulfatase activity